MTHWLKCEIGRCLSNARYMCRACGKLVCERDAMAESDDDALCLACAVQAGLAGAQAELFAKRTTKHDQRTTRSIWQT